MNASRKRKVGLVAIIVCVFLICTEILVIARVLPFDIIGGGRLPDYKIAVILALVSIMGQLLLIFCILAASGFFSKAGLVKFARFTLKVFTVYFVVNIVLNIMGKTWFERVAASILCLIQIICFVIIIRDRGKNCLIKETE